MTDAHRRAGWLAGRHATPEPQETAAPEARQPATTRPPVPAPGRAPAETADELAADLALAQAAVAALTDDLQRLQAEYVNYKRRVDRDRELVKQNASFSVLSALLPVLDDIGRAREHGELEGGFKAVADALHRRSPAQGLVVRRAGRPVRPALPRGADARALGRGHTTTCQTSSRPGYQIGDRVVRPAQVAVVDPEPQA